MPVSSFSKLQQCFTKRVGFLITLFFKTDGITDRNLTESSLFVSHCLSISLFFSLSDIHYLPKVLGHPLLMKDLTTLVISMSTNLNV